MAVILHWAALIWVPLFAMFFSAFWVYREIAILCKGHFVAEEGERHIHKGKIPTAGGLGMIFPFLISCALYYVQCLILGEGAFLREIARYALPILLLTFIGIWDDRKGMRAEVKLGGQALAALISWVMGLRFSAFFGIPLPTWVSLIFTVFWFLLFINAYNLIDGLDGLAAGLAIVGALSLAGVLFLKGKIEAVVVALTLIGVCLGFLRYNFHPARIFMGDTGSMFLGYTLAALGLITSNQGTTFFAMVIPVMACGVPLFDTALAVWRRATFKILSKRSWHEIMTADRNHLHHRILDVENGKQTRTAIALYTLAAILSLVGIAATCMSQSLPMISVILILLTLMIVVRKFAVLEIRNSTQLVMKGLAMPPRGVFVNILHPIFDLLVIILAIGIPILLFDDISINAKEYCYQLLISALIVMAILGIFGAYRVYWLRAGTPDYVRLFCLITIGYLLVLFEFGVIIALYNRPWSLLVVLFAYLLTLVGILGERIVLSCMQLLVPRYLVNSEFTHDTVRTVLVGAGAQLPLYVRFAAAHWRERGERVIGILDNDVALLHNIVFGYRVLGSIYSIEKVYAKYQFTRVVVTVASPFEDQYQLLKDFCAKKGVELRFFTVSEAAEPLAMRPELQPEAAKENTVDDAVAAQTQKEQ